MRNTLNPPANAAADAPGDPAAHIEAWVRTRFALTEGESVLVKERPSTLPGFPPVETIVDFWTTDETRHHFKVFKPRAEVLPDDLPFSWQKSTLAVRDGYGCECC